MSEQSAIIGVRLVYRILGVLICIVGIGTVLFLFLGEPMDGDPEKYSYLVSVLFVVPILLPSCILGRVPDFIMKFIPERDLEYMKHAEKFFLEYSYKSKTFAIGFLTVAGFYIWISML